jgi:hypothetical protein
MTREEIKREVLNNDLRQESIKLNAQFISLVIILIRKGIIKEEEELNDLNKLIDEQADKLTEKVIDEVMKIINKESE